MGNLKGSNQVSGNYGRLWWDGELIAEVESFEAKLSIEREDTGFIGEMAMDSKITGYKGEGSFRVKKFYSRGIEKIAKAVRDGRDPRSELVGRIKDPDGKGTERVVLSNVWFNEVTLMKFERGALLNEEFSFGFTDFDFPDVIALDQ